MEIISAEVPKIEGYPFSSFLMWLQAAKSIHISVLQNKAIFGNYASNSPVF
ncbi:MAG: hypothetical protein LUI04_00550 [Porphyromonadaceae bacterium]|nr:hypothetical protein [Porphyromonadaceae bacterium]